MNSKDNFFSKNHRIQLPGEALHFMELSGGLRLVHKSVNHSYVAHCGLMIHAGSRDDASLLGLAHCMEHMLFKGTTRRKSFHILNRLDSVGGEINAYTTKEITALYTSIYDRYLERAIELMFDITFNSVFPKKELVKEKSIIWDEIKMYQDSPDENIFDEFQELLFQDHPLATNILGTEESLKAIQAKDLIDFRNRYYTPQNLVLFVASDLPTQKIVQWAEKYVRYASLETYSKELISGGLLRATPPRYAAEHVVKETDHVQSYWVLGGAASSQSAPHKLQETLLLNILGGPALNSRLNLSIREKYGFTYHVEAGVTHFSDSGFFHCYAGTDPQFLKKTQSLIYKELQKLCTQKMGVLQLNNAVKQLKGQMMVAEENKLSSVMAIARPWLQNEKVVSLPEIMAELDAITASDLLETANRLFQSSTLCSLAYVPAPES